MLLYSIWAVCAGVRMCALPIFLVFFLKHKTAYDMRIGDWSSDVCSSDLDEALPRLLHAALGRGRLDGLEAVDGLDQQGVLLARHALATLDHRPQRILQDEADQDDERHHGERHEDDRSGQAKDDADEQIARTP